MMKSLRWVLSVIGYKISLFEMISAFVWADWAIAWYTFLVHEVPLFLVSILLESGESKVNADFKIGRWRHGKIGFQNNQLAV